MQLELLNILMKIKAIQKNGERQRENEKKYSFYKLQGSKLEGLKYMIKVACELLHYCDRGFDRMVSVKTQKIPSLLIAYSPFNNH